MIERGIGTQLGSTWETDDHATFVKFWNWRPKMANTDLFEN